MDGLKLKKWQDNFNQEVSKLEIEFDAFFKEKKLDEYFTLTMSEVSQNLSLKLNDQLPAEVKKRMEQLFMATMPEDSV